jgi:hypothetical protein
MIFNSNSKAFVQSMSTPESFGLKLFPYKIRNLERVRAHTSVAPNVYQIQKLSFADSDVPFKLKKNLCHFKISQVHPRFDKFGGPKYRWGPRPHSVPPPLYGGRPSHWNPTPVYLTLYSRHPGHGRPSHTTNTKPRI